jgi:hypothetical protein
MYKIIGGNQQEYGPVSTEQICQWIAEGRLNAQSQIQPEGSPWTVIGTLPEFQAALAAKAGHGPPPLTAAQGQPTADYYLARPVDLDLAACLSRGWADYRDNFGLFVGSVFLVIACYFITALIPFVGGFANLIISGPLQGGLCLVFLRRIRRQPATIGETFSGFNKGAFLQLLLASVLIQVITSIGFALCVLPGLYLFVAWIFAIPLVADKKMEFWPAMELSRRVVTSHFWKMAALLFLLGVIVSVLPICFAAAAFSISGFAGLFKQFADLPVWLFQALVGLVGFALGFMITGPLTAPFAAAALLHAYEQILGEKTTAS